MNAKLTLIAGAVAAICLLPGIASATFVLDTGVPTGSAVSVLSSAQFLAGEFSVTAGTDITQLSAYLTEGTGQPNDTFTFDVYAAGSGFTARASSREAPVFTAVGTFSANGWNSTSVNWTPSASGNYWLALQVASPVNTKGLDAPSLSSAGAGAVPALGFAYAPASGQYTTVGAPSIGLEISSATPVPLPGTLWLLGGGVLGVGAMARRRGVGRKIG